MVSSLVSSDFSCWIPFSSFGKRMFILWHTMMEVYIYFFYSTGHHCKEIVFHLKLLTLNFVRVLGLYDSRDFWSCTKGIVAYEAVEAYDGQGLNVNCLHRHRCLHPWSPAVDVVWRCLGMFKMFRWCQSLVARLCIRAWPRLSLHITASWIMEM